MGKVLIGFALGIFLISILTLGFVIAGDNETSNETNTNQTDNSNQTENNTSCSPVCESDEICVNSVCVDNEADEEENETETEDNETESDDGKVTINKTRISRENLTFTPWQKRNESECLEGCFCHGAVMSCETENGRVMTIQAGRSGNIIVITIEGTEVETELEVETDSDGENDTELKAKMSNGQKKEIKIMPNTASEKALEKLRLKVCSSENNCTIQLKEVGNKPTYEVQAERHMKILALFTAKAQVKAQVDAETGNIIVVKKPWWAFLATEPEE